MSQEKITPFAKWTKKVNLFSIVVFVILVKSRFLSE